MAVAEITSGIQQAEVNHGTTSGRGSDAGAWIAGKQPMAREPIRCRDAENIRDEKAPLEIYDIGRELIVVDPEGEPEKADG